MERTLRDIGHEFIAMWDRGTWLADYADTYVGGTVDPDDVSGSAVQVDDGVSVRGWDCWEGWDLHQAGQALYMRVWRDGWGARIDRDLWVLVDPQYFSDDDDDEGGEE